MSCIDCGGSGSTRRNGTGAGTGARGGVPTRDVVTTSVIDGPTLDGPVTTTGTDEDADGRCADLGAIVNAASEQDWTTLRAELSRVPWWAWALLAVLVLRRR